MTNLNDHLTRAEIDLAKSTKAYTDTKTVTLALVVFLAVSYLLIDAVIMIAGWVGL